MAAARDGQVLRLSLRPALVLVTGQAVGGDRVRMAGARPEGTVDGYHLLEAAVGPDARFELRLPAPPAGAEVVLSRGGAVVAAAPVPAAPVEQLDAGAGARVARHDVGRLGR